MNNGIVATRSMIEIFVCLLRCSEIKFPKQMIFILFLRSSLDIYGPGIKSLNLGEKTSEKLGITQASFAVQAIFHSNFLRDLSLFVVVAPDFFKCNLSHSFLQRMAIRKNT